MPSTSSKQQRFFQAVKHAKHNPGYGDARLHKVADSMTDKDINDFAKRVAELKMKKAVLAVLKDSRESIEEIGGSDEQNASDKNVITKEFNVEGKFEEYVKRFLGQRMSEKEMEAVNTFQEVKPTKIESNQIRYETADEFKNNTTTIIKKLREGSDFVYVAFTKYGKAEKPQDKEQGGDMGGDLGGSMGGMGSSPMLETDQPTPSNDMSIPTNPDFASGTAPYESFRKKFVQKNEAKIYVNWPGQINEQMPMDPMGGMSPMGTQQPAVGPIPGAGPSTTTAPMTPSPKTPDQRKKEMGIDDILIRKSPTFRGDIDGGRILASFLKKLDL